MDEQGFPAMTFAAFAEAITPIYAICAANPLTTPRDKAAWLATVWDSTITRLIYCVDWGNGPLKRALPPAAQQYCFDEADLRASTEALGLEPQSSDDTCQVAELLATRNAWVSAIQQHCQTSAIAGRPVALAKEVLDDYVRLTSDWTGHPVIQQKVRRYVSRQLLARMEACLSQDEDAEISDPSPSRDVQVIHARPESWSPQQAAKLQAEQATIGYWLEKFDYDNRCWSSVFEVNLWVAENDIELAGRKVKGLQALIDAQRSLIRHLEGVIRTNKRRAAQEKDRATPGRPKQSPERQAIAHQFTAQWVQSLMALLEVKSCARLGEMIANSSQRNWRRWLNGEAIPTRNSLAALGATKIVKGPYKGTTLNDMGTTPTYDEMVRLIRLAGLVAGGTV